MKDFDLYGFLTYLLIIVAQIRPEIKSEFVIATVFTNDEIHINHRL
jgi:hypothetical protein